MPVKRNMPTRQALLNTIEVAGSKTKAAKCIGISLDLMQDWCRMLDIKKGRMCG